jgi:hypothetical protein
MIIDTNIESAENIIMNISRTMLTISEDMNKIFFLDLKEKDA